MTDIPTEALDDLLSWALWDHDLMDEFFRLGSPEEAKDHVYRSAYAVARWLDPDTKLPDPNGSKEAYKEWRDWFMQQPDEIDE